MHNESSRLPFQLSAWSQIPADMVNYLIIGLVWIAMVILANPLGDFPLNDDWVYALAVKSVLETGYYHFPSPASANVGPQVYWGALFCLPFGFSFTALRLSTLTVALIGILTLYQLIRTVGGDAKTSMLGSLALAVNPLYFGLANSFMTDIPFTTLALIALYYLVRGFQNDSRNFIAIGLLVACASILVRQLGMVILVGFALANLLKYGFSFVNIAKGAVLVAIGLSLHVSYQYWMVHTGRTPLLTVHSDVGKILLAMDTWRMRRFAINFLLYMGFFLLPALAIFIQRRPKGIDTQRLRILFFGCCAFAVLFFGVLWWNDNMIPSLGNVLVESGLGPLTLRDTFFLQLNDPAIPQALTVFWTSMTLFAAVSASAFIYFFWLATRQFLTDFRSTEAHSNQWLFSLLVVTGVAYFSALMFISGSVVMFDRYLIFLVPIAIALVTNIEFENSLPTRSLGRVLSVGLITIYAGLSVAAVHDYLAWNRTRWVALHSLLSEGKARPNQIDGGYEFNGWFLHDANYKRTKDKSWWWVDEDEYVVTSGALPGYTEYRRYSFSRWLLLGESNILILRKASTDE
jgi:hypothetical protein